MANITEHLNKIKNAIYGRDVRVAIHEAIKTVYDDASINHDNANMEVKLARGSYNTLNERLSNSDNVQNQFKQQLSEINNNLIVEEWYSKWIKETTLGSDGIPSEYSHDNYELFFDWILNPLAEEYPDYVYKTTLGKDTSNTYNVYKYELIPDNYDRTVIMLANVHGNEYTSFFGLCRFVDDLCRNYSTDSNLYFLRHKVKLVLVPIVNPWGFVNSNRRNVNGVDLNRNTSYRWDEYTSENGQVGGKYYKGTHPFSEKESQYIKIIVDESIDDNLVGFIDLHTLNTIEADKVLYYPRFAQNAFTNLHKILEKFDAETGNNRTIFSSSAVPTFSNFVAHTYGINACNPEFSNSAYGGSRTDVLMSKHVEWIGNIAIEIAKTNRKANTKSSGASVYALLWDRDVTLETEDENRTSGLGHRVLKSNNFNSFEISKYNIQIDRESVVTFNGHVRVYAESDCTLDLEPLVYQQYSPEQNYNNLVEENRFAESVRLKAGSEVYIPIAAVIHGFHTNYNDEKSTRAGNVHFRIRAKANVSNAVYITGYKVNISITPSDLGKCVVIERLTNNTYQTVYPLRIAEEIED